MKKNTLKIITLIILIILSIFFLRNNSFASSEILEVKVASSVINPNDYKPTNTTEAQNAEELGKIGNSIIGVLQIIGTIVSVVVIAVLGIKYMVGSVEEKAQYKKTMVPYLIGAVMVFAITNLLGIIIKIVGSLI